MPAVFSIHPLSASRRRWLASLVLGTGTTFASAQATPLDAQSPRLEVWVDLSEPVPAGAGDAGEAKRRRQRLAAQQERVAAQLRDLGAVEVARVRHARNSIAVQLDPAQLDAVRLIPGVLRVRPVRTVHPPRTTPDGSP